MTITLITLCVKEKELGVYNTCILKSVLFTTYYGVVVKFKIKALKALVQDSFKLWVM
jgi:hypothetical protein